MAKIIKKTEANIIKEIFYIDSAKFLVDSNLFEKIDIPNNIIELDGDTGEQLREFKRNSLQIPYKGFTIYISNYTKVLKDKQYKKLLLLFSAKVCERYLKGIRYNDFKAILEHLREFKYVSYKDDQLNNIISNIYTKDTDIAYNIIVPANLKDEIHEQWKLIKRSSVNKEKIKIGNSVNNQMIQFGKRGEPYFFKIYNKSLEVRSNYSEFQDLPITPDERKLLLSRTERMYRIEITIRNKADFKRLNTSSKLVDLWQVLEDSNKPITKIIRRYYDEMTGSYVPKKRVMSKLTPTDKIILAQLIVMKSNKKQPQEMLNLSLSLFDSHTNKDRMTKSRAKAKIESLIDYLYTTSDELIEKQEKNMQSYKYIEKMFFLNAV